MALPISSERSCVIDFIFVHISALLTGLKQNTNVVELYSRLAATEEQLNYYNSGVGTFAQPPSMWKKMIQKIDNTVDLAIAWCV